MFEFFRDMGNYEDRKVDCFEEGDLYISTVRVSDGNLPFETAIAHPSYNDGKLVIVEAYHTKESSQKGHDRWVETMTAATLPTILEDCNNSGIQQFCTEVFGDDVYEKENQE